MKILTGHRSSYQHPFIKSSPLADRFDKRTIECAPLLYHCISRRLILISSQLNKRVSTYLSCTYLSYRRPTRLNLKIDHDFLCCASVKYIRAVGARGARGRHDPLIFDKSVKPISTKGVDYTHHITTCPSGFSALSTALILIGRGPNLEMIKLYYIPI